MIWRFLIVYLLSAIAANLIMTFLMRYSEHHDDNRYALNIWNYLAGTLISIIFLKDKWSERQKKKLIDLSLKLSPKVKNIVLRDGLKYFTEEIKKY